MSNLKKKGLGRGLDALLGGAAPDFSGQQKDAQQTLAVGQLQAGKYQPRQAMDQAALAELADSIRAQGIMQPLLVRPISGSSSQGAGASSKPRYEIIAGERRFRAAQLAGLTEVPVIIRQADDQAALAMALIENLQREDLSALEEAQGIDRLIREFGLTHEQAASAVGRSRSATTNLLRLLQLPEAVQEMLRAQTLDAGHARALLPLAPAQQRAFAEQIAQQKLSVRDAERIVAKALAQSPSGQPRSAGKPPAHHRDWVRVQDQLSDLLNLPVVLRAGRGSRGELIIRFPDLEAFEALVERLVPGGLPEA
jgi:ParB family transcriptional regulator, chromosome partitioning protein